VAFLFVPAGTLSVLAELPCSASAPPLH
jgi:hypothetical protein